MKIERVKKGEKILIQSETELMYFHDTIAETDGIRVTLERPKSILFIPVEPVQDLFDTVYDLKNEIEILLEDIRQKEESIRKLVEKMLTIASTH